MKAIITQNHENREIEVYKDGKINVEFVRAVFDYADNIVTAISIPAQQIIDFPKGGQTVERMEEGDECDCKQSIYFYPNCYFEVQRSGVYTLGMVMGFGEYGDEQGWADVSDYQQLLPTLRMEYTQAWAEKYQELYPKRQDIEPQDAYKLGE